MVGAAKTVVERLLLAGQKLRERVVVISQAVDPSKWNLISPGMSLWIYGN
jgi:hypothetical protein